MSRQVFQSALFARKKKKMTKGEIAVLDGEVRRICEAPEIGEAKRGELTGVLVHKFKVREKLFLLAYEFDANEVVLLSIGPHENFCRDLKRYLA
jgi:hypothetical protein